MRAAWAIAVQTLRSAWRSKLVLSPALVLLFITVFLPFTLKGDGTPDGLVRLTIGYTLGMVRFVLALTAIWTGCSAVSGDLAERPLYLVLTKPVRPLSVWMGKWMGLSILLTVLLAGCAILAPVMLIQSLDRHGITAEERRTLNEEVLVSRTGLKPLPDTSLSTEARTIYTAKKRAGEVPENLSEKEALHELYNALEIQANRVDAGEQRTWHFQVPPALRRVPFYQLCYAVMAPGFDALSTEGRWDALDAQGQVLETRPVTQSRGITLTLRLPARICSPEGGIVLRYTNTDTQKNTILFPPQSVPELLVRSGTFYGNYLRMVLVLLIQLLFWTAIGVTAGCFFSQPVAVVFTGWLILLTGIGAYLQSLSMEYGVFTGNPEHALWNWIVGPLYWLLHQLVRPLESEPVMDMLLSGEQIGWLVVLRELGIRLALYSGLLALFGAVTLKRREIGLPVKSS
ncbi:MAG: hypothetical protein PHP44_07835 [Kiritimatiellae bacterium]|nr:hypothetical protein [Kiritimatiellia bacterium]MDD4735999.1 hypothetical protein [Kiritimatiellia bacterium]